MDEEVADSLLIDVRDVDMASLLSKPAESSIKTALDRLLVSDVGCNSWNSYI